MRFIPLAFIFLFVAATAQAGSNVKALSKQYRRLDANRDGLLTSGELAKLLPGKLTKNNALVETQEAMFAWFDEDASEGIDLSEWLEAQRNTDFGRPYFSAAVIDELDTNGNGKLTWKEFSRVIPKYVSAKKARGWFNAVSSGLSVNLGISGSSSSDSFSGGTLSLGLSGSTLYIASGTLSDSATLFFGGAGVITLNNGSIDTVLGITQTDDSQSIGAGNYTAGDLNTFFGTDVVNNGTLNPGNGPGVQTFASDLTLGSTSVTTMEIAGSGGVAGTNFDSINVTGGTLTNDGSLAIVDFGGYDISAQTGSYNLFDMVTGAGNFDVVTVDGNSLTYNVGTDEWSSTVGGTTYNFNEGTGVLSVSE
jgi:hypothetical protein